MPDADPHDGTTASLRDYPGCAEAAQLQLIRVEGGGHTWPGGPQYLPRAIIGLTSQDFAASEVIWAFFAGQS
jgi:polyhydroxybutyrate depolymerase